MDSADLMDLVGDDFLVVNDFLTIEEPFMTTDKAQITITDMINRLGFIWQKF